MADRIDIAEPLEEIIHRLGLEYRNVTEIIFRPGDIHVTSVVRQPPDGSLRLVNGEVPLAEHDFKVMT